MIDVFANADDTWQDADDIWYRGPFDDALTGCVFVNPRMSVNISLAVNPLMSGILTSVEYLKGIFTVKPHE